MSIYPHKPLGEIADVFVGAARSSRIFKTKNGMIQMRLLGMKAIKKNGISVEAIESVDVNSKLDWQRCQVKAGDLLIPCRGSDLRVVMAPEMISGVLVDSNILVIRCGAEMLPVVFFSFLKQPQGHALLERASQSTTKQKNLTVRTVQKIEIPFPPMRIQKQMARLIESAQKQYDLAIAAAEKRLTLARQITVTKLFS